MNNKRLIYDLSKEDLMEVFHDWHEPPYRINQLWEGLYQHLWNDSQEFTVFPKSLRARLSDEFTFMAIEPMKTIYSSDGETQKTLFYTRTGNP
ncbi:MAG: 23S rRNA (adenine(2503)-C2)-methyltransferase, partial [Anaerolineales bacterium]